LARPGKTPKANHRLSLNGGFSSGEEMRYEQHDCDYQQQVYRAESNMKSDKAEQPQNKQNSRYSSKHDASFVTLSNATICRDDMSSRKY
jgi:hypothetical protein